MAGMFKDADKMVDALDEADRRGNPKGFKGNVRLSVSNIVLILGLILIFPIWLLGMNVVFTILKFMRQPALYGSVPVWLVIAMVILFIIYVNKNR